jgi:ribosomal protein L37AE/L43A
VPEGGERRCARCGRPAVAKLGDLWLCERCLEGEAKALFQEALRRERASRGSAAAYAAAFGHA